MQLPIRCPTEGCLVTSVLMAYCHFSKTYPRKLWTGGGGRLLTARAHHPGDVHIPAAPRHVSYVCPRQDRDVCGSRYTPSCGAQEREEQRTSGALPLAPRLVPGPGLLCGVPGRAGCGDVCPGIAPSGPSALPPYDRPARPAWRMCARAEPVHRERHPRGRPHAIEGHTALTRGRVCWQCVSRHRAVTSVRWRRRLRLADGGMPERPSAPVLRSIMREHSCG
jgi:hypothetical protein